MRLIKSGIILLILILLSVLVYSSTTWSNGANSGNNLGSSSSSSSQVGRGIYAGYLPNDFSNTSYGVCTIPGTALFEPLAYDYDKDGQVEFILTTATGFEVYNKDCIFENSFAGASPNTMPVLMWFNSDKMIVWTDDTQRIEGIHYNPSTDTWTTIINSSIPYKPQIFSCGQQAVIHDSFLHRKCFIENTTFNVATNYSLNLTSIDFTNGFSSPTISTFTQQFDGQGVESVYNFTGSKTSGMFIYPSTNGYGYITFCSAVSGTTNKAICSEFYSDKSEYSRNFLPIVADYTNVKRLIFSMVNVYGVDEIILTANIFGVGTLERADIYSKDGSTLIKNIRSSVNQQPTNLMVGDYTKDGKNEVCEWQSSDSQLHCFDSAGNETVTVNVSYSISPVYVDNGNVMADFEYNNNNLCIADITGIYCKSGANLTPLFSTGFTLRSSTYGQLTKSIGTPANPSIVVQSPTNFATMMFIDNGSVNYIMSFPGSLSVCGDLVCQPDESAFSCPVDCLPNATTNLSTACIDADPTYICKTSCPAGYTTQNLSCASLGVGYSCCAPSITQDCSLSSPGSCVHLGAQCINSELNCRNAFLFNNTVQCAISDIINCTSTGYDFCLQGACGLNSSSTFLGRCNFDSDCPSFYPECFASCCTNGLNLSLHCNSDNDCTAFQPICFNNFCIKQTQCSVNATGGATSAQVSQSEVNGFVYFFDSLFFLSKIGKLFFSVFLTIVVVALSIGFVAVVSGVTHTQIPGIVYIIFAGIGLIFSIVFNVAVGTMSVFVPILFFVGAAGIGILYFMLKPGIT